MHRTHGRSHPRPWRNTRTSVGRTFVEMSVETPARSVLLSTSAVVLCSPALATAKASAAPPCAAAAEGPHPPRLQRPPTLLCSAAVMGMAHGPTAMAISGCTDRNIVSTTAQELKRPGTLASARNGTAMREQRQIAACHASPAGMRQQASKQTTSEHNPTRLSISGRDGRPSVMGSHCLPRAKEAGRRTLRLVMGGNSPEDHKLACRHQAKCSRTHPQMFTPEHKIVQPQTQATT